MSKPPSTRRSKNSVNSSNGITSPDVGLKKRVKYEAILPSASQFLKEQSGTAETGVRDLLVISSMDPVAE
jgi:hypothetical protein